MTVYAHDRIVFLWWAESMLRTLINHFGHNETTRIYVLYSTHETFAVGGRQIPIVTALPHRINRLFVYWARSWWYPMRWLFDYRNLLFFYPLLCRLLRRKIQQATPDRLVISSFAAAKNLVPISWREIPTTLYLHSPMQYIWENYSEYMQKLSWLKKMLFQFATSYLRPRDKKSRLYETVYANSRYTASCAQTYYSIDARVWYPPLDTRFFSSPVVTVPRDYFVYVGRLVRFIREVDVIIEMCNTMQLPLLILWSWPDEDYLKSIAWPTITFVWQVTDVEEKIEIVKHARWLINLAKESCGIATMEAVCLWVPVFWYAQWGSDEIVCPPTIPCETTSSSLCSSLWVLTTDKQLSVLIENMKLFLNKQRSREEIQHIGRAQFSNESTPS